MPNFRENMEEILKNRMVLKNVKIAIEGENDKDIQIDWLVTMISANEKNQKCRSIDR